MQDVDAHLKCPSTSGWATNPIAKLWGSPPQDAKMATNLDNFKGVLDQFMGGINGYLSWQLWYLQDQRNHACVPVAQKQLSYSWTFQRHLIGHYGIQDIGPDRLLVWSSRALLIQLDFLHPDCPLNQCTTLVARIISHIMQRQALVSQWGPQPITTSCLVYLFDAGIC